MKLGLGLGVNSITSQKVGAGFTGILDEYSGAAAAYSVRRLSSSYLGSALRVRRSSDDAEQDIGFDANGDLDTTALTTFVNEEITDDINTTTDSNADGLADGLTSFGSATYSIVTGNGHSGSAQRVDYNTGGSSLQAIRKTSLAPMIGQEITISFMYRSNITWSWTNGSSGVSNFPSYSANTGNAIRVTRKAIWNPTSGSSDVLITSWLENSGEFIEISDWSVTYHTADGAVTTFYDQSGNGNDATNSTDTEQPLVVSGGTLVEENGKAAIQFDGVDDLLSKSLPSLGNSISDLTSFVAAKYDAIGLTASALFGARNGSNYGTSNSWIIARQLSGDDTFVSNNSGGYANAANDGASTLNQTLFYHQFIGGSQVAIGRDGGVLSTNTTSIPANVDLSAKLEIGAITAPSVANPMDGKIQELIIFDSDQSSNRGSVSLGTGIEGNINEYFDIV